MPILFLCQNSQCAIVLHKISQSVLSQLNNNVIHSNDEINDILGNKIDREDREIPTEVGEEFSQRHGMYFLETSAKASDNVERLFTEIAQDLLQVRILILTQLQCCAIETIH